MSDVTKQCTKCGHTKALQEFSPKRDRQKLRYASCCKACAAHALWEKEQTPAGKAAKKVKNSSTGHKTSAARYATSAKGKTTKATWIARPGNRDKVDASIRKYWRSDKGRANQSRANTSDKGRARAQRFDKTAKGKACKRRQYDRIMADPALRLKKNIGQAISKAVHELTHPSTTVLLTGMSSGTELMNYLETTFSDGMDRTNHGAGGWDVEHLIPKCEYDHSDYQDVVRCWNWRNLRACWHLPNQQKSSKLIASLIQSVPVEYWPKKWGGVCPV